MNPPPLVAVAKFTVISGTELDKVVFESNGSPRATATVTGDNLLLSIDPADLLGTFWCLLHYLLDVSITGSFSR